MAFETTIRVRFDDEDHAGIVYFPWFFHFFHSAFEDFFVEQGVPYRECFEVDRIGWPSVHAEADFIRPTRFGDALRIEMWLEKIGNSSAVFSYRGWVTGDATDRVRAKITVACLDMNTFRATPIPPKYRALFEKHLRAPAG